MGFGVEMERLFENRIIRDARKIFCLPSNVEIEFNVKFPQRPNGFIKGCCKAGIDKQPFTVLISEGLTFFDELLTMCHELVHVRQLLDGRLVEGKNGSGFFDGVYVDITKTPYEKLPWEIEAFQKQNSYLGMFLMETAPEVDLMARMSMQEMLFQMNEEKKRA